MEYKKIKNNYITNKSPRLKGKIIENILILLCQKEWSIYELQHEIQQRFPASYKAFKKHLIYLIDYELVSYNGQKKVCLIEDSGIEC